jgi:asparagine synthase (glutamine-hydrolysing)
MCGIYAAMVGRGRRVGMTSAEVVRLRDMLAHRGPDGAGVWESPGGHVVLAHRRLAVIDPTDSGAQPMSWPRTGPARWVVSYNGELYNDAEIRRSLAREGVVFATACDTETVVAALDAWGVDGVSRFRGMFALVAHDVVRDRVYLVRDPLGVKPLYWAQAGDGTVYAASEPAPIVASPGMRATPNWRMVSAYISTIRTTMAGETMFEGVRTVRPGSIVEVDLAGDRPAARERVWWTPASEGTGADVDAVREAIEASVVAHLRADVPMCCLLSGGLDSTIIAAITRRSVDGLRTYAAGAAVEDDEDPANSDLVFGARAAAALGTRHAEAILTRDVFLERWRSMVGAMGVPMSTPNETAINLIAHRLRADGCIVTVSGEGADELFGGYDAPIARVASLRAEAARAGRRVGAAEAGVMELVGAAWAPPGIKDRVVRPEFWRAVDGDAWMLGAYGDAMRDAIHEAGDEAGGDGLGAHLRMHRRFNLAGLLQRLDTATMLAGVEGRTPFADARIAMVAEALPMAMKLTLGDAHESGAGAGGAALAVAARTKIVLREAFAGVVPGFVMDRAKRSFPVPFRRWIGPMVMEAARSELVREVYPEAVIAEAVETPETMWHIAWPMANLGVWGDRWWGSGAA